MTCKISKTKTDEQPGPSSTPLDGSNNFLFDSYSGTVKVSQLQLLPVDACAIGSRSQNGYTAFRNGFRLTQRLATRRDVRHNFFFFSMILFLRSREAQIAFDTLSSPALMVPVKETRYRYGNMCPYASGMFALIRGGFDGDVGWTLDHGGLCSFKHTLECYLCALSPFPL